MLMAYSIHLTEIISFSLDSCRRSGFRTYEFPWFPVSRPHLTIQATPWPPEKQRPRSWRRVALGCPWKMVFQSSNSKNRWVSDAKAVGPLPMRSAWPKKLQPSAPVLHKTGTTGARNPNRAGHIIVWGLPVKNEMLSRRKGHGNGRSSNESWPGGRGLGLPLEGVGILSQISVA